MFKKMFLLLLAFSILNLNYSGYLYADEIKPEHLPQSWSSNEISIETDEDAQEKEGGSRKYIWWIIGGVALLAAGGVLMGVGGGSSDDPPQTTGNVGITWCQAHQTTFQISMMREVKTTL